MELHPNLQPFAFLLGSWAGDGRGFYPTIKDFSYSETVTFTAAAGKPFFRYEQKSRGANGPMHTEVGFLRPVGEGNLELVIAQPTGQTELLAGKAQQGGRVLEFGQSSVVNTATAKHVDTTRRIYTFNDDFSVLSTRFDMGAVGQPLQQHLASELSQQDS
ncbi:FABP family protein [Corynebacterium alimapuense]|uniref:Ferric nitrobindin-like protein n=1 Tax=Corynebacterium alimapuense TaxID=1576874 RepID=A0A3M8K5Z9_9CORY|nr:FABP family protein [Corynebacterium alimapuense]RNE48657.1 FABP family protein [Corynebacterium alimapuense]